MAKKRKSTDGFSGNTSKKLKLHKQKPQVHSLDIQTKSNDKISEKVKTLQFTKQKKDNMKSKNNLKKTKSNKVSLLESSTSLSRKNDISKLTKIKNNRKFKFQKGKRKLIKRMTEDKVLQVSAKAGSEQARRQGSISRMKLEFKPVAKLPQKPEDFSCNWIALQKLEGMGTMKKKLYHGNIKKSQERNTAKDQSPEIWFDGVDEFLLETSTTSSSLPGHENSLVKSKSFEGITKAIGMDCEMVGAGEGGEESILARVSLVNQFGKCIYDKYVKATEKVTDYRTEFSGIRQSDIQNAAEFKTVQKEVSDIITGRILVGHALHNDLKVLYLDHPHKMIRDTQRYKPFRKLFAGKNPSLKKLTAKVLDVKVQEGEHSSVQDAQAAMRLYTMYKKTWEKELPERWKKKPDLKRRKRKKQNNSMDFKKDLSLILDSD